MTPEGLRELIQGGESFDVEFKGESREALNDHNLVEAVVCLANRGGERAGWLLVGVEDDGRVTGARQRHAPETDVRRVEAVIAHGTRPSVPVRAVTLELDGKPVLVIEVPAWRNPVATAAGKYVRRATRTDGRPECVPFLFHEMQGRQADLGLIDVTTGTLPGARWEDLDPLEFARLRRTIRESSGRGDASLLDLSDFELAKALGAVEGDREPSAIRLLGILLFGTEAAVKSFAPTHEAAFQDLTGTDVGTNDFFRWPLVRITDEILGRCRARTREQEVIVGMQRIGVPDYPERAIREAVANALIHRDYTRLGAVHVQWHADRLEISNPGGFPDGVRLDNILVTPPHPRNPGLADAFKRAGIVERSGRGIDTIFEEQLRTGRPPPSYERSTSESVVVVLPGGAANLEFVKLVVEQAATLRPLKAEGLLLFNGLWLERRLDGAAAAKLIQKPEREARAVLERLVEAGLVEARGERDRTYTLSASVYRRLGNVAAYVRQRDNDPLRREEKILEYVAKHGQIVRGDVMDICGVEGKEAQALLAGLVSKGVLERYGERRWTFYELAKPKGG
ncbi:MAG TPA: ATP-binding protein [Planctomycetota bacterium]|nr:ATP-binding protein [Planctomycetota bacterium]